MAIDKKDITRLIALAEAARNNAYAPYSGFCVGAALLSCDDGVFTGANVENVSYGATICAERVAFDKAVSEGSHEFKAIAIVGGEGLAYPCGICRQVMAEFCGEDFLVIVAQKPNEYELLSLGQLLPKAFKLK
ncbi:MAG: cytidine deaminase [Clostridia bacterium]|mgnify:CR=1 FL=1|jgi:cytidine deaminase|nr:cytidine deaminase [Clostridia bacterium]MDD4572434.1 cytidine deaminase [Clostridia bacterium]